jgi:hypothetical protein
MDFETVKLNRNGAVNGFQTRAAEMNLAKLVYDIQPKTDL